MCFICLDPAKQKDAEMRAFIILGFLMAAANAAGLGYNYGPGLSSSVIQNYGDGLISQGSGLINTGGGLISNGGLISSGGGLISNGGGLISSGGGLISSGGGLISSGSGLISSGSALGSGGLSTYGGRRLINIGSLDSIPQTVEINKQFFHFTAPEEAQEEGQITQQLSNVLKKNLQVIFIKAPENNAATNAALQLARQAIEQKTNIYVLTKQNDGAQLVGQIQQIQENVPTTPEVRFIKYRTNEDIVNAKNIIQSQYNNIGGTSQVIDGGVAPVLNYASHGGAVSGLSLLGSGISSGIGSGIGSGLISTGGSHYSSGIGSDIVSNIGSDIVTNIGSSSNYLPPSPLKK